MAYQIVSSSVADELRVDRTRCALLHRLHHLATSVSESLGPSTCREQSAEGSLNSQQKTIWFRRTFLSGPGRTMVPKQGSVRYGFDRLIHA